MKQQRSAYLVTKSLKQYLVASIIALAVFNLNAMVDSILMGNFLGPEVLAAINLCLPVVNFIAVLGTLLSDGAVLIAAKALGEMDRSRVNEVFSLSSFAQWITGLVLLVVSAPLGHALAQLISNGGELASVCEKYIRVLLLGSAALFYANTFGSFLNICGHPKSVTLIMSLSVIVNILLDILFVKVIGMDVSGAAWASVAGSSVSILGFVILTKRGKDILKLVTVFRKPFAQMGEIMAKSVAPVIGAASFTVLVLICNTFIQKAQGTAGMFVLSVGYSMLDMSSMVASGMSSAFMAIGGTMMGQKDYRGLLYLFRKGMIICLVTGVLFLLISLLIPKSVAVLFGADTEELQTMASQSIPLVCTFILAITVLVPCSTHFQVIGRYVLSSVVNLSMIVSILVSCLFVSSVFQDDQIWLAFPLAGSLCILILLVSVCVSKLAAGKKVTFPELIPDEEPSVTRLDISVSCTQETFEAGMRELWDWLGKSRHSALAPRIAHCVEEMLLNTIRHSGRDASHDIDLLLCESEHEVTALLKDDGIPFNTSVCLSENKTYGLILARHFCPEIEYNYSFGQNMTLMKWTAEQTNR